MFTELSGLFFIRKIMYFKKQLEFIEEVIYRQFSSWELQEH